jgi:hypothetical protein
MNCYERVCLDQNTSQTDAIHGYGCEKRSNTAEWQNYRLKTPGNWDRGLDRKSRQRRCRDSQTLILSKIQVTMGGDLLIISLIFSIVSGTW